MATPVPKDKPAAKAVGRSIDDFKAAYDKSFIVPRKIKEALAKLGDGWLRELDFAKLAGVNPNDLAAFRAGFARLAPLGLSFDAWLFFTQIGELTALARAYPETPIVLDHVGGPLGVGAYAGRRDEVFGRWAVAIRDLATCPNVCVKLGGLGMAGAGLDLHARPEPPSSEALAAAWRPYMETCIEAFGAARCMFESNFPVDKGMCGYAVLWNAFKRLAAGASATEKAALFSGTAVRAYRLDRLPPGIAPDLGA